MVCSTERSVRGESLPPALSGSSMSDGSPAPPCEAIMGFLRSARRRGTRRAIAQTKPASSRAIAAVALSHGSMSRSRAAATSAPAKFGIRPCGGNGKRATPSALSLSQTHCRAALLSAKSRAMTESGAARPGDSQGRSLLRENLGRSSPRRRCTRRSRSPCSMGRPRRRPTAIQAALRNPATASARCPSTGGADRAGAGRDPRSVRR
jgi:hypothetical protein